MLLLSKGIKWLKEKLKLYQRQSHKSNALCRLYSAEIPHPLEKRAVFSFCISYRDNKDAHELLRIIWDLLSEEMNSDGPGLSQQWIKVVSNWRLPGTDFTRISEFCCLFEGEIWHRRMCQQKNFLARTVVFEARSMPLHHWNKTKFCLLLGSSALFVCFWTRSTALQCCCPWHGDEKRVSCCRTGGGGWAARDGGKAANHVQVTARVSPPGPVPVHAGNGDGELGNSCTYLFLQFSSMLIPHLWADGHKNLKWMKFSHRDLSCVLLTSAEVCPQ